MGNYRYTPLYRSWDAISIEGERSWIHELCAVCPPAELNTQGQVDKAALRQGLQFVREHPSLTIQRAVVKFFDFWGLERELVAGAGRGLYGDVSTFGLLAFAAVVVGAYVAVVFLAAFGLLLAPPIDRRHPLVPYLRRRFHLWDAHDRLRAFSLPLTARPADAGLHRRRYYPCGCDLATTQGLAIRIGRRIMRSVVPQGWTWSFIAVDWARLGDAIRLAA